MKTSHSRKKPRPRSSIIDRASSTGDRAASTTGSSSRSIELFGIFEPIDDPRLRRMMAKTPRIHYRALESLRGFPRLLAPDISKQCKRFQWNRKGKHENFKARGKAAAWIAHHRADRRSTRHPLQGLQAGRSIFLASSSRSTIRAFDE